MEISHRYDDIIELPHHVSDRHPQMPLSDRAAQFSPFAALTGYDAAVEETARWTEEKRELTEEQKLILSARLRELQGAIRSAPAVTVLFFVPDARKAGGSYQTLQGRVKKIDEYSGLLELTDGTLIPFEDILGLEAEESIDQD